MVFLMATFYKVMSNIPKSWDIEQPLDDVDEKIEATIQWEFQDPKMEVLYHIRPYFVGIFPYIGLT